MARKKTNSSVSLNDNEKPLAIILVGLPASGKSTWAEEYISKNSSFEYVSLDKFIDDYATSVGKTYSEVWKDYVKTAQQLYDEHFDVVAYEKTPLIIDQTNLSKNSRKQKIDKLKNDYDIVVKVFQVSDEVLVERLNKRAKETGKFIPHDVISSMKNSFEMPTLEEGFIQIL